MNSKSHLLSVCIPTYEMRGLGADFLSYSLNILSHQTFTDFDVVISDYSCDKSIEKVCKKYKKFLDIKYYKNNNVDLKESSRMSGNTNNAILHATGKLIKILFLDDFLYDKHALATIVANFNLDSDYWMVTASEHSIDGTTFYRPFFPRYNNKIIDGINTISSPSVLVIKNENPLIFDENLCWLMDCDYYKRYFDLFGEPKIVNTICVVNRTGKHQISQLAESKMKRSEHEYIRYKHTTNLKTKIRLPNVTLVAVSGINSNGTIEALEESMKHIEYYEVLLIGHTKPKNLNSAIHFRKCKKNELVSKDPKNTNDYSKFMAYHLHSYIKSDFALVVHKNAHVVRPDAWNDYFLNFDYIGAPWPKDTHYTSDGVNIRVGNGGFSLRSKKLLTSLNSLNLPFTDNQTGYFHEDGIICVYYRSILESNGISFAPVPVAARFSGETICEDSFSKPFGYHDNLYFLPLTTKLKKIYQRLLALL